MKRIMLFSLVFLGLVVAMSATSSSTAGSAPAAPVTVGVVNLEQEIALLGQGGVTSTPTTCVLCLTTFNCTGHEGAGCANNCSCKVCGGQLGCRPDPPPGGCDGGPGHPCIDNDPPLVP